VKLKLSEIFAGLEGEGVAAGTPTVFVRLAGCNLRCRWCDTKYASRQGAKHRLVDVEQVEAELAESAPGRLSVTGGEPTHQLAALVALAGHLRRRGYKLHLESNGTRYEPRLSSLFHSITLSPKLPSSGTKGALKPKVINSYLARGNVLQLKFVVANARDISALAKFVPKLRLPKALPLVVQPVAGKGTLAAYGKKGKRLAEAFERLVLAGELGSKYDWRFVGQWQLVWGRR